MLIPAQCQSEVCLPGSWLACDTPRIHAAPDSAARAVGSLGRHEVFEVIGASTRVLSAGVVRVTRDTRRTGADGPHLFAAGDLVYVLDHRGEGFFNVWRQGRLVRDVEVFWPGRAWSGFEMSADVLQEPATEFWLNIVTAAGVRGWALENERLLSPLARIQPPMARSSTPVPAVLMTVCPSS